MTARKTTQALKISASWTPTEEAGIMLARTMFGAATPLRFDGGRIMVKAAIKLDLSDPAMATQVAARAAELRNELEATGKVHSFNTQAGAVPTELVEVLPAYSKETDE